MDLTSLFLILIGVLVITVIYLQLRLSFTQPPIVYAAQPSTGGNAGCAVAALVILAISFGILLAVFFGPVFSG